MAEETGNQRYYRAPCPGCGAPVEFRSAQSTHAVCPYCQSTVVRQGETLARTGKMAELFDDFSPLQLFAAGRIQDKPFTLIGRLQYTYPGGRWTEWIAALDGDRTAILSEDNGAYVFALPFDLQRTAPPPVDLRVGATSAFAGQSYTVTSNEQVALTSAQGELPHLPELGRQFAMVELRNDRGLVLSIDYGTAKPSAYLGRSVQLDDLQLTGLRAESAKDEKGRSFNCPNCGSPVTVNFADSKSITCGSCNSIIDLSQGIGGELKHAVQDEPVRPLIALGSMGQLQGRYGSEDSSNGWQCEQCDKEHDAGDQGVSIHCHVCHLDFCVECYGKAYGRGKGRRRSSKRSYKKFFSGSDTGSGGASVVRRGETNEIKPQRVADDADVAVLDGVDLDMDFDDQVQQRTQSAASIV